jgi:mersacidin/lichenicidin family type 2 lantibiotic
MKNVDVIRAWKNKEYRMSLSDGERAMLPANPAGAIELNDAELAAVGGAAVPTTLFILTIVVVTALLKCGKPPQ